MNGVFPNPKGEGLITEGTIGRDAGGGWPNALVIGPKVKDNGLTSVEAEIGRSSSRSANGSTVVFVVVGAIGGVGARRWVTVGPGVGGCGEGDLMPFGVAAPSAFLSLLRSPLLLLFPLLLSAYLRSLFLSNFVLLLLGRLRQSLTSKGVGAHIWINGVVWASKRKGVKCYAMMGN